LTGIIRREQWPRETETGRDAAAGEAPHEASSRSAEARIRILECHEYCSE
jgi:hypothetical protein